MEHRLSENLRDGVMALRPARVSLLMGGVGGALLLLLASPMWFLGRCVFSDEVAYRTINPDAPPLQCDGVPGLPWYQWLGIVALLVTLGIGYSLIHRLVLQRRMERKVLSFNLYLSDVFAAVMGVVLATGWALYVPKNWLWPFAFTELVIGLSVVVLPLWWRLITLLGAGVYAYTAPEDPTIAATIHMMLARQFRLPDLSEIQVRCEGERLEVTGPFDAVDKGRIDDLVKTGYPVTFKVHLNTTLSDELYWRPHTEELGPTGYKSKPLEETRVPAAVVYSVVAIGIFIIAFAVSQRPRLALSPQDLRSFAQTASDWDHRMPGPVSRSPSRAVIVPPKPWSIDVAASEEACPAFGAEAQERWRAANEAVARGSDEPVLRIHATDEAYYLFFIDRTEQSCQREFAFPTFHMATTAAVRHVQRSAWQTISDREDWRSVPPVVK